MGDPIIRKGHVSEIAEIMELIARCIQVMREGGSDQWDERYPNAEVIGSDIAAGTLFVLDDGGAVSGIIVLDENQAEEYDAIDWSERQGPQLIMHRLAVHPQTQGRGVARQLIAFAERHAAEGGYASIRLDTYAKNERALRLYPSLGYEPRGEVYFPHRETPFPVFEKILR